MDLLNTLLLYMTITFASAVQGAPADVKPTPTPLETPPPYVEMTVPPQVVLPPTLEPTASPTPKPTATPKPSPTPKPTAVPTPDITPNNAYKLLREGDKGENVKKMQARLIELGYLKGEPDGAFGRQTLGAVLNFQARNGLSRDGEAGKTTLTVLFEYADVVPAPTPTPKPTNTPKATAEVEESAAPEESYVPIDLPADETAQASGSDSIALTPVENAQVVVNKEALMNAENPDARLAVYVDSDGVPYVDIEAFAAAMGFEKPESDSLDGFVGFTCNGHKVEITPGTAGLEIMVDGNAIDTAKCKWRFEIERLYFSADSLEALLGATVNWTAQRGVLAIDIPE